MENSDRDKLSRNPGSTEVDRDINDESGSEFGQNIGRPERLNEPDQREGGVGSDISERDRKSEIDRDQSGSRGRA
ncbi:MAG TPA: hypothetical protein VNA04_03320 [Thermoanaerobaculia bacterium]|nr:hypothetical protein [Thermoanaerobaculia bacterium]